MSLQAWEDTAGQQEAFLRYLKHPHGTWYERAITCLLTILFLTILCVQVTGPRAEIKSRPPTSSARIGPAAKRARARPRPAIAPSETQSQSPRPRVPQPPRTTSPF